MTKDTDSDETKEKSAHEAVADPGVIKMERYREKKFHGKQTRHMEELKQLAALEERVLTRVLEKSREQYESSKKPHLTIVK